jgi:hypothetical protein
MLTCSETQAAYPIYNLEDIQAGSLNTENEGYYDNPSWWIGC